MSELSSFNHVGICVRDRHVAQRFYEGVFGFEFWWELDPPDDGTAQLLQLEPPVGAHATYLVRDGLVLELISYAHRQPRREIVRVMDELGLTHISLSVPDMAHTLALVPQFGGAVEDQTVTARSAMVRDPDGQLLELLTMDWLNALPPRP
ncbi:VOC family protein [Mycolicibacterium duvalii]|uniref:VOC family protein n=1 Tax=Mycolicibacterium duvalii TaxID=39688 RepID=UPI001F34B73E|nr:VOC family protein [Mycolicibacterium duvalii]